MNAAIRPGRDPLRAARTQSDRRSASALAPALLVFCLGAPCVLGGWGKWLAPLNPVRLIKRGEKTTLDPEEIAAALRQTLETAAQHAVDQLSGENGFVNNPELAVPIPRTLQKVESVLRKAGQGQYADQFHAALNKSAALAVREGVPIFRNVIENMSFDDVRRVLTGGDDAAVQYLREKAGPALREKMLPIVRNTVKESRAAATYQQFMEHVPAFAKAFLGQQNWNLEEYVTDQALDRLFQVMAVEEKKIRTNPAARTTELLKKVFGAAGGK